ncbi:IPT/TIG domain-containing protein [Streptomyces sporangiiformans]|uniref:Cell shape-determining protein n=1 Tax=Streptomyces sporangiiformans TaxID=2315329 RepID=A0A505CWD8_9ACTN|nr:IPT/TIG domain-containing protein [Streptomyces sporangiiformans]TPQ15874.1 cell shape-determining protein [Streptomyces sporangiiformans]
MAKTDKAPTAGARPSAVLAAPVINLSSPVSGVAGTTVTLTGSGFTGVTAVKFGAASASSYTVVSTTKITAVAPAGSGTVQITVTTTGGTSNGIGFTYTIATPVISAVAPVKGPTSGGNTVTLTGTSFNGATQVRFGNTTAAFAVVSATQITATAPARAAGTANITVVTPGGTSNGIPYTYVVAPTLAAVTPNQGPLAGGNAVVLTGTGLDGATQVRFGTAGAAYTVDSATQITATVPAAAAAAGDVAVTVVTPGGTTSGNVYYHYLPDPAVSVLTPSAGPTAGGNAVTLTGSHLLAATAVSFGATPAMTFTVVSDDEIDAVAPAQAAGTVTVSVTTPGGTSSSAAYTYLDPPTLSGAAPDQGPTAGGNTVTLTGENLTATTEVRFGTDLAGFTVVSDTLLTAVAPPGPAGTVSVTATTPAGTSTSTPYTRLSPPGI